MSEEKRDEQADPKGWAEALDEQHREEEAAEAAAEPPPGGAAATSAAARGDSAKPDAGGDDDTIVDDAIADADLAEGASGRASPPGGSAGGDGGEARGSVSTRARGRRVELDEFDPAAAAHEGGEEEGNIDVILDIPVTLSMEIGRTQISIRHLLQLNQGSVVELDRLAGEPLDVMVNGTLIAHGEVVVVNERFGIRLTDVISPAERVKKLR
ncbi:flagellar motor switch protein FliN [Halorhodospira abdelmalekii]|uniref:flagellar motor switch protein FliN n=1 Tax=Halorhodospira abdelmalekii TaxID=421629 RepID=UPI0019064E4F|nr:flagellar motor switch protein FliN [Halorhodospira abdelmalekii]MBK1735676.1 flagellar motor switch protein FliN [Halorhodospira abdelmalekii]